MKSKTNLDRILGLGLIVALASPQLASSAHAEVEIGLAGGLHVFSPNNELAVVDGEDAAALGDTAFIGARLGLYLGHMLGLEGELGVMPASFSDFDIASTVVSYRLQAVLQFGAADPERKLLPFVLLGAGLNTVPSIDATSPTVTDDIDSMAYAGVGAKYRLGGGWGVRLDARAMLVPSTRVNTDDPSKDKFAADYEVLASIYKSFGGKRRQRAADPVVAEPEPAPVEAVAAPDEVAVAPEDADQDGLLGDADKCAAAAEDFNGFEDADGCPDGARDTDSDGILDLSDKCVTDPEAVNGYQDSDGCPDVLPTDVQAFSGRIEGVKFKTGSAKIARSSFKTLGDAAKMLAANPTITVEIGGHTDETGDADKNAALSQARADAVRDYLIAQGVDGARLQARGYGESVPVGDNATDSGRAQNRRVEFKISSTR